jgi:signal transduction histidine kinase
MNGIIGMTELALETDLTSDQRDLLETARSSADALLRLLNDLLDYSKIDAQKVALEQIAFEPRRLFEQGLRGFAIEAAQKGLSFRCEISDDVPPSIVGDPARLRQVLANLLANAIKFTHQGGISVQVRTAAQSGDTIQLHFSVRDTGIGIPPEKQELIFQPFCQADGSMTRKYGGTGLGLTICTRLVELMGGRVWLDSVPGEGSAFHFVASFGLVRGLGPNSHVAERSAA